MMRYCYICLLLLGLTGCASRVAEPVTLGPDVRIVSLNGTLTEILWEAGFADNLAGVDVTSTYPAGAAALPRVGHNRNINVEGILSLQPDVVVGKASELEPEIVRQLRQAGLKLLLFEQEYSVTGSKQLIRAVTDTLGRPEVGERLIRDMDRQLAEVKELSPRPRALFIYARGAGTLMVAGDDTQMQTMLQLAGAENAVSGFSGFKPLTPEVLLAADPEVIVLFDRGLSSLEGEDGLLAIPGIAQTTAGRRKAFIAKDGQLLSGFGPRLGQAVRELHREFKRLADPDA